MQRGAISPPHPEIASLKLIKMDRAMSRLERDQHIPEVSARLKNKQVQYKQIKAAIQRVEQQGVNAYAI
jgi:transcriptional regulator NrdR family protein